MDGGVKTGRYDSFMQQVRKDYERAVDFERANRDDGLDDLKFRAGEQWPDEIRRERETADRPIITVNRVAQFVRQVTGDIRLNKPAIKVRPVDDAADTDIAKLLTGLIRNIEQQSSASSVYASAAENASTCGQAAWRITTEYVADDAFEQDIRIKRINNPFAVVWDPSSEEPTREDAKYCFVVQHYDREEFEARWPNASLTDFDEDKPDDWVATWQIEDKIVVAEYWCKKPVKKRLSRLADGSVVDVTGKTELEIAQIGELAYQVTVEQGHTPLEMRFRDVETHKVEQHFVNGSERLEEPYVWPGKFIPIIPVIGEEIHIGERTVRHGLVRFLKDPQRLYNYDRAATVESIALAPKAPFKVTLAQIAGFEDLWNRANTDNLPYLPYNADPEVGGRPPERERQAELPVALIQDAQIATDDMNAVTGIYPASLGQKSNETSGKAILARERQGDVGTYVYIDNLSIAIGYTGRQLVDLIPKIYDSERVVRVLGEDDAEELKPVNQRQPDGTILNDLSLGKYDTAVSSGPSFSTRRQEASEAMLQMIQSVPDLAPMLIDLLAEQFDWPGADKLHERLRKQQVATGVIEPDPEKGDQVPEPAPPTPQDMEAQAKAEKMQAETVKIGAEAVGQQLQNMAQQLELGIANGEIDAEAAQRARDALALLSQLQSAPNGGFINN